MTREELEKWWWWEKQPPRRDSWAAYNYELASRASNTTSTTSEPKQPHYLLDKAFHQLTPEQKALVRYILGSKIPRQPVEFLFEWQEPPIMPVLRLMRQIRRPLTLSAPSEHRAIAKELEDIEQRHVKQTGCTFPRLITINLHASEHSIMETFKQRLRDERRRFGIPESKTQKQASIEANTGNAKRHRKPPFQHIEALDLWRNFRERGKYDSEGGQQSRAAKEALRLRQEWHSKLRKAERERRAALRECARVQEIIEKLQRGEISDTKAARLIWAKER